MTLPQILAVVAAGFVAAMYLKDFLPARGTPMLTHMRHVMDIRDTYKTPEVASRCNALLEALLGIKP